MWKCSTEPCDLAMPWPSGCSAEIEVKKTQIMTQVMDTIHHCPINQGGLPVPCSLPTHTHYPGGVSGSQKPSKETFSQNEKRSHAQQCCMKRQICCCGDVCHQSKQFLMSLQEDAATPGWDWWNFCAWMGTGCILHLPSGMRIESMAFGQSRCMYCLQTCLSEEVGGKSVGKQNLNSLWTVKWDARSQPVNIVLFPFTQDAFAQQLPRLRQSKLLEAIMCDRHILDWAFAVS